MTTPLRYLARFPAMAGWPGGIGLALLGAALVLTATLSWPVREENALLKEEIRRMALPQQQSNIPSPAEIRQQLDAFVTTLPKQGDVNQLLNRLHDLAARHNLSLKNSEYRTTQNKSGRIGRLQVSVKTEGTYPDLRDFLREVPQALPALALGRLSLTRQKLMDTRLETVVEFTLFYSQPET